MNVEAMLVSVGTYTAELDALLSLSAVAKDMAWTRPTLTLDNVCR